MFFDLYDEDTEGVRPDRLFEVRPQERDQRHTVEQVVDNTLVMPSLEPAGGGVQLDTRIPELAVEVPKISSPLQAPSALRDTRLAEQLVEVPTMTSCCGLRSRSSTFQFLVVEGEVLVFKVFFPDRVRQCSLLLRNAFLSGSWSRSLLLACLVEAFKIFAQDRVHLHLLHLQLVSVADELGEGVCRTFPRRKKCEDRSALGVGTECGFCSVHAGCLFL